jgi:hypothetical protein
MDSVKNDFDLISSQLEHDYQLMQKIHGENNF